MRIINTNLHDIPVENYGEFVVDYIRKKYIMYKYIQSFLYILVYSCAASSSILAAIVLSNLHVFPSEEAQRASTPAWYYLYAGAISAVSSFISGMLNFFLVKEKVRTYNVMKNNIFLEIIKYKTQMVPMYRGPQRDYNHFIRINIILGSSYAKKEVIYG